MNWNRLREENGDLEQSIKFMQEQHGIFRSCLLRPASPTVEKAYWMYMNEMHNLRSNSCPDQLLESLMGATLVFAHVQKRFHSKDYVLGWSEFEERYKL